MSRFFAMVRRELKSVTKEKTIVLAIVIQLFVASFSSVIVTGLMAFYDPDSIGQSARTAVTVGVVDQSGGPLSGILRDRNLRVRTLPDTQVFSTTNRPRQNGSRKARIINVLLLDFRRA